jgi:ArsC family
MLGGSVRDMIRDNEPEYKELGLAAPALADAALYKAIAEHPILLQRPIVIRDGRAVVGRPPRLSARCSSRCPSDCQANSTERLPAQSRAVMRVRTPLRRPDAISVGPWITRSSVAVGKALVRHSQSRLSVIRASQL